MAPVKKVKMFYLHELRTLTTVSSDYKHFDTVQYDIFAKSSYNDTQFK